MSSYVFIDTRVQDWEQLLAGLAADVQIVLLDPARDGITQIAQALEGVTNLDAIHIISHGTEGTLYLGDTVLTSENLNNYTSELAAIGAALSSAGDILLYGCEVANGTEGQSFIDDLALHTGADVTASTDTTGNSALSGDWVLEASSGSIESSLIINAAAQETYTLTLDTITGTSGNDTNLSGTSGDDTISGLAGNDTLNGGGGNDLLDGGDGIDTAGYSGSNSAGYSFSRSGSDIVITDTDTTNGSNGIDTLIAVENASFADGTVSFTGEFRINTSAANGQIAPSVSAFAGGGFVVTWSSYSQDSTSTYGIYAQRYDVNGIAQGSEFRVNTTTTGDQSTSSVTALTGGGFVVTWQSLGQDGNDWGVYGQRYDANGIAQGVEFRVNTTTTYEQSTPLVAALTDGGFVVTWQSSSQDNSGNGVYGQRYDANGIAQGVEFQVNTATSNDQSTPSIAALGGGGFVVTWQSTSQDGSGTGVYGQRYDANGVAQSAEFRVNSTTSSEQNSPSVAALSGGGFVVTWQSFSQDGNGYGVYGQRYDANGVVQGVEFQVNTATTNEQGKPSVGELAGGGFVVVWQDFGQDGSSFGVYGQRYDANGVMQGSEFRVNTTISNQQVNPAVAAFADGSFVVTWQSFGQDGNDFGVYAQRYDANGNKVLTQLSGDVGANTLTWSDTGSIVLSGAAGNDTLIGNGGNDTLDGGTANDSLIGNAGIDTAAYDSASAVTVNLTTLTAQNTVGAGTDTLAGIENVLGSSFNDTLTGDANANVLTGGDGNDTLTGGDGNDSLMGGTGSDSLIGGLGNDTLLGNEGVDTVSYATSTGAVVASLLTNTVTDGLGGTDTISGFENVVGGSAGDNLTGDGGNNSLVGGGANDTLLGGDGDDTLNGGAGDDVLNGGTGINTLLYSGGSAGYSLNIVNGSLVVTDTDTTNGSDGADTLAGIFENVGFSNGAELVYATGEFRVNTTTTNEQSTPSVAVLSGGGFVVTWQSYSQDGDGYGVYGQCYDANGITQGAEFRVNATTAYNQSTSSVSTLTNGAFVVTWQSDFQDGGGAGVYGQRYDANGVAQGIEFRVNTFANSDQSNPAIAALMGGGFVVTWQSDFQDSGSNTGVYGQRYDANGVAQGGEFRVNTTTTNTQSTPSVAALNGGGFVVTWQSFGQDSSGWGVYGQRYDANGVAQGVEFRVNTTTTNDQSTPSIAALTGGGFVVTWQASGQDGSGYGVYGQRYDANGVAQGVEFPVNTATTNDQSTPSIAALSGGGFVVTWQSLSQDGSGYGVYGQSYDANGAVQGAEFRANTTTVNSQGVPSVSALAGGGFVVTWQDSSKDGSSNGIYAQRYDANGNKVLTQLSGDAGANTLTWAGTGSIILAGGAGNDTVIGNAGSDTLEGGDGNDSINGGAGIDIAAYDNAMAAVTVNLATAVAQNTVGAGTDTLVGIENVLGSSFNDTLTGDANANVLTGGDGNDTLTGGDGNDSLVGGTGNDTLTGGAGNDSLTGGAGDDTIIYAGTSNGYSLDIVNGKLFVTDIDILNGNDGVDTITGELENLVFSDGVLRRGSEFRVNSTTAADQSTASTVALLDGGFFAIWQNNNQVVGQRFDANGGALGIETQINTTLEALSPAHIVLPGGGFVVTWYANSLINAQYFDAAAAPIFNPFTLPLPQGSGFSIPSGGLNNKIIANNLGFVLVWDAFSQASGSLDIYAQRFNTNWAPIGQAFAINATTVGQQNFSQVTATPNGPFVVTWNSDPMNGTLPGVYARVFNPDGSAVGGEFLVSDPSLPVTMGSSVAYLPNNAISLVVVWSAGSDIYARSYFDFLNPIPIGSAFRVNTTTDGIQVNPKVIAFPDGGFMVTWKSSDGSADGIFGQRYSATGMAVGSEFRINTYTTGDQTDASITALSGGGFVATWSSFLQDGSGYGIYAQRYDSTGNKIGALQIVGDSGNNGLIWTGVSGISLDGLDGSDTVSGSSGNDTLSGGAGNDSVTGGSGNDTLSGGAGDDVLTGGAGIDIALYDNAIGGVTVNLATAGAQNTVNAGSDTLAGIENLLGSAFNDALTGDAGGNMLTGGTGHDTLTGNAGNDTLDGSGGSDTASYSTSSSGMNINLSAGTSSDGVGGTDTFISIENVVGSGHADTLTGDAGDNHLTGREGNDTLDGGLGSDTVVGGEGNDTLGGGLGSDIVVYNAVSNGFGFGFANGNVVVTDINTGNGDDGTDTLVSLSVESASFTDGAITFNSEFRANTTLGGTQDEPAIAALSNGGFVVVWEDSFQDSSGDGIYGQRYNANGVAEGTEFRVNTTVSDGQIKPVVTAISGGGFVVAWQSFNQDSIGHYGVYAQRYDATGVAQGTEFKVNTTTAGEQSTPAITALPGGGFVATWQSQSDGSGYGVYAQRYDANGAVLGSEFLVNTFTGGDQWFPVVAALSNGQFVVSWQGGGPQDGNGVYAKRFDSNGVVVGSEFRVNTVTFDNQDKPTIAALTNGGFVVAWQSYSQDGDQGGIYAKRYDSSGVVQDSEFRVNTITAGDQKLPAVTALTGGGFVVVWQSSDGSNNGVYAQRYDVSGAAIGGEFRVNTYTSSEQASPSIAALSDGGFVVSWHSFQDSNSSYGVYAQRYNAAGDKVGLTQLVGDFNANTLTWVQSIGMTLDGAGGNDTLNGGAGNDVLIGGQGNDSITGGAGIDTASYIGAFGVTVNLATVGPQSTGDGTDTLSGVENLLGSASNDTLTGDDGSNVLSGTSGNDTLAGGAGNDTLDGSDGTDTVTYAASTGAVTGNLATGTADDGMGGTDTLISIENLIGSNQSDSLTGDGGNNSLTGGLGNDTLIGGDGNDTLNGGAGDDVIDGGAGVNVLVYTGALSGYSLNLANGNLVVTDIDTLNGNDGVDTLIGNFESVGFNNGTEVLRANGEFRVNTATTNNQDTPAIAGLPDGGWVVTWQSSLQDGSGYGIYAQRYDSNGAAVGIETRVNTTTANGQELPAVTALAFGGFVVTWESALQDGALDGIYAQRFDATGAAVGGEIQINTTTTDIQDKPAIAASYNGGFVVVWESNLQDTGSYGIYARRYDADGIALGGEIPINTTTADSQSTPAIANMVDGGFIVSWQSNVQDGSSNGIYARRYDANGDAIGDEFVINTTTLNSQDTPALTALADGGFVVTWQDSAADGGGSGIYAQRYDSNSIAVGSETRVNTTTANDQRAATITALVDGGYVVSWQSNLQDGSGYGIYARRYDINNVAIGAEFRVNTTSSSDQIAPAIAALPDGGFVVSWQSNVQDGSGYGIYAQRYDAQGNKVLTQVTGDANNNALTWTQDSGIVLDGAAGNDTVTGGAGNDTLTGGIGNDTINGGSGTDWASYSGTAAVAVNLATVGAQATVGAGSDTLTGIENLLGGAGGDTLTGDAVNNAISGAGGNDTISGSDGDDLLDGGEGNDSINGGNGADTLNGGGGTDTLNGDAGTDLFIVDATTSTTAAGGADIDVYLLRPINANVTYTVTDFTAGVGGDQIDVRVLLANTPTYAPDDPLLANPFDPALAFLQVLQVGADTHLQWDIDGVGGPAGWVTRLIIANTDDSALVGGDNGNFLGPIIGTNAADTLIGAEGADVIIALAGDDILDGGEGNDFMRGDAGNDLYYVDSVGDIVIENNNGPEGLFALIALVDGIIDTVLAAVNYSLTQFVENLTLSGTAITGSGNELNNIITGNELNNTLYGLDGNDSLIGGLGNDTLWGGLGNDTLTGSAGADVFAVAAGNGIDLITDFTDIDAIQVSGLLLTTVLTAGNGSGVLANQVQTSASGGITTVYIGIDGNAGADLSVQVSGTYAANQLRFKGGDLVINHAPTVPNLISNQNVNEDSAFNFVVPANIFGDVDAGDTLTYTATKGDGTALPAWLNFNANTRTFSGTPANANVGNVDIKVTASDSAQATVSDTFTIAVANTNDAPTLANAITDKNANEDSAFNFVVPLNTFSDIDTGDTLTYSATKADGTALPVWLTFTPATRTFSGTPTNADVGSIEVKVTAKDSTLVSVTDTFTLTVANTNDAPTLANAIPDQPATQINTAFSFTFNVNTFADIDAGDNLTYSATKADGGALPAWLTFTPATRTFSGTPLAGDVGSLSVKVIATDGSNATVFDTFIMSVAPAGISTTGTAGPDSLTGSVGNDILNGAAGNDTLNGGDGDDTLTGSTGDDSLSGGVGLDWAYYNGAGSAVTVNLATVIAQNTQGAGTDTLNTIEHVLGSNYHDTLTGNSAANQLDGGAGNDTLDGGSGNDTMKGGGGNDQYTVAQSGDVVIENAGGGTDTVLSGVTHTLAANVEHLTLTGVGNSSANGNSLANNLTGNSGNNTLNGGTGNDTMIGGLGNDTYVVNAAGDVVTEAAAAGTDLVQASTSHTLGANVENLTLTGAGNSSGNGNGLDNILTGNSKNNMLNGGTGNDTMMGGAGNDTYSVNAAGDVVTEAADAGTDTVNTAINYTLTVNVENLTQTGSANTSGTGNTQNNKLTGNSGNNTLSGNDGADTLTGGSGNDTLTGGTGIDIFDYNALADAADTITDFTAGAGGDKLDIDTLMTVLGYGGTDPLAAGYVQLLQAGAHTQVNIDSNGGGDNFATTLVTLQNVTAGNVTLADNFIV